MSISNILFFLLLCCLIVVCPIGMAQEKDNLQALGEDNELLEELLAVLDEGTSVATKTRMNADFVPGMVTVLQGSDLEAFGIRTVWEALTLAPGVQAIRDSNGGASLVVRGLNFPFNNGNVKLMVNSISMSRESSGFNSSVLLIPIEQVERIEFVRGPGSVLYGDFAFMGVVNIITRKEASRFFARIGERGTFSGGGQLTWSSVTGLTLNFSLAALQSSDPQASLDTDADEDRLSAMLSLAYKGFSLSIQTVQRDFDDIFGSTLQERNQVVEARQKLELSSTFGASVFVSYLKNDFRRRRGNRQEFTGDLLKGGADLSWNGLPGHTWLLSITFTDAVIDDAQIVANLSSPNPDNLSIGNITNKTRRYWGISLQNQFAFSESLSFTAGLRFDHRNDIQQNRFTPRFAAVWRAAEGHIVKAQYAEGFRAPTFFELFPQPQTKSDLNLEVVETIELSYIYRRSQSVGRATLFHSRLDNMIFISLADGSRPTFGNFAKARSRGIELEWEQQWHPGLKWQAGLSYVDSWTTRNQERSREEDSLSSDWLASFAVLARPSKRFLLSSHWYYIGRRNTPGQNVGNINTLDLTLSAFDWPTTGLTLRVGVKNIFNKEPRYLTRRPMGTEVFDYPGRRGWFQVAYSF